MRSVLLVAMLAGRVATAAPALPPLVATVPACDAARTYCVGLRVHVPPDAKGVPVATAEWIAAQVASANAHFETAGIGFEIDSIHALPASAARIEDREERDTLGARLGKGVVDWFVTAHLDDIDEAGQMIYGVTWRRGARKFVVVSTQSSARVLTHELGHFFGLPHSTYPISLMNKTPREDPPYEARRFADEELPKLAARARALICAGTLRARGSRRPRC